LSESLRYSTARTDWRSRPAAEVGDFLNGGRDRVSSRHNAKPRPGLRRETPAILGQCLPLRRKSIHLPWSPGAGGGEKVQRCRTKPLDDQNGHRGDGQSCWPRLPPVSGEVRPSPSHDLLVPSRRSGHDDRKVRGASKGTEPCGGASRRKRHLPQIPHVPEAQGGREAALRDQTPCPSARATNCVVAGNTTRIGPAP